MGDLGIIGCIESLGKANFVNRSVLKTEGSINWVAPEVRKEIESGEEGNIDISKFIKANLFSVGLITLFALDRDTFKRKKDFLNRSESVLVEYLKNVEQRNLIKDEEFLELLKNMLNFDVKKRIDLKDVYEWLVSTL